MFRLEAGAILIQTGTRLPQSFELRTTKYAEGWNLVQDLNGDTLDGQLRRSNWNLVYISGKLEASARGSRNHGSLHKAATRLLAKAKHTQLNCVEITQVLSKRFLGLSYVQVTGRSRHVQESLQLETLSERRQHLG